jgi:tetratricopeptide (TPR) repeat protein
MKKPGLVLLALLIAPLGEAGSGAFGVGPDGGRIGAWIGIAAAYAAPPRGSFGAGAKSAKGDDARPQPPPSLDDLYRRLKNARSPGVANRLAGEIQARWLRSGSDTVDLLMQRALAAIAAKDTGLALDLLDAVLTQKPDYAEAWHQRAVAHFARRDFDAAIEDVDAALRLEPRHYGALVGLATMLGEYGYSARALDAYRRALAIHPFLKDVAKKIEDLSVEVEGRKA